MDSLINTITSMGTSVDKTGFTKPDVTRTRLTYAQLLALYAFNGYAKRVVDVLPDLATRTGWTVMDDTKEADPMGEEDERLQITARVAEADVWGRLGGGSLILIVTDEDAAEFESDNVKDLLRLFSTELDLHRVKSVANLVVLDRDEFSPFQWETNPASPRFRRPKSYTVTPSTRGGSVVPSMVVHASRVLEFHGSRLPPSREQQTWTGMGDSVLESTWDAIRRLTTSANAAEVLTTELKQDVLKIDGLAKGSSSDQAATLNLRMKGIALGKSFLNMILLSDGDQFTTHSAQNVTGWSALHGKLQEGLSAVTGYPVTMLFGQAPGGLSTDDAAQRDNTNKLVSSYQERRYSPILRQLYLILYSQKEGPTGGTVPKKWRIEFNPLDEPTQEEIAAIRKTAAETDLININSDVMTAEHVAESRYGDSGFSLDILPIDIAAEKARRETDRAARQELLKAQMAAADTDTDTDTDEDEGGEE